MTDGDVVRLARRIDDLNWKIRLLMDLFLEQDHPNGKQREEALVMDGFHTPANATHVILYNLLKPERWEPAGCDVQLAKKKDKP